MKKKNEQKNIRTRGIVQHLLENLPKEIPLLLTESTWRDKNAIRPKYLS